MIAVVLQSAEHCTTMITCSIEDDIARCNSSNKTIVEITIYFFAVYIRLLTVALLKSKVGTTEKVY